MTEYLLAVSLGPVQDFIAAGRKTRDLWFGSQMLSDISREVAAVLRDAGATLIFPSPDALDGNAAVANKLLATVSGDPAALVTAVRDAAKSRLRRLAAQAVGRKDRLVVDEAMLFRQLDDFLELYAAWALLPTDYMAGRSAVERLLAGRKALRDFQPPGGRAGLPKSALDPSRESVIDWRAWPKHQRPPAGTHQNEHLDGISLVKRLAEARRFVSVSRIAVDPLVRCLAVRGPETLEQLRTIASRLQNTGAVERFSGFRQFEAFPFDVELWYRDDDRVEEQTADGDAFRQTLSHGLRRLELGDPPAYYAVLAADGDRMGSLIGEQSSIAEHQDVSRHLVAFAAEAEQIIERHHGAPVYSGGDDVLAFLPLDQALACAGALSNAFKRQVRHRDGSAAALTVGLAFVHYLEPLAQVLAWAREAEQAGKNAGRNALTVALHTRSGGATCVMASWDTEPVERWDRWISLLRGNGPPGRAAYELRRLGMEMAQLGDHAGDAIAAEAGRILGRKREPGGETPVARKLIAQLLAELNAQNTAAAVRWLADELIIARHVAAATALAEIGGAPQ